MPDKDNESSGLAEELAERYYLRLLHAGEEALTADPLVELSAAAEGKVLWRHGNVLEGYAVSKLGWDEPIEGDPDPGPMGLDESLLQDGTWVLKGLRYERKGARWLPRPRPASQIFAHYDRLNDAWHVVQFEPDAGRDGVWVRQPGPASLSSEQKAVIARIAEETEMLLDAALTLQDDHPAYDALARTLIDTAKRSGDRAAHCIGAIVRPRDYPTPGGRQFHVSAFGNLHAVGVPLYRAVAARASRDSTDLSAAAANARLCPPYEPVRYGLSRYRSAGRSRRTARTYDWRRTRSSRARPGRSRRQSAAGQSPAR